MSKVTLLQFPGSWGLPNASPFCLKLETWMRLFGVEYEVRSILDPSKTPKGKLPCIVDDGQTIADSSLILDHLKASRGIDPEADLDPAQRSEAVAWQRLCDDHLYWVLVWSRWVDDGGWPIMGRAFEKMPLPLRWIVPPIARRNVRKQLHAQGIGRHTRDEIYGLGIQDVDALATRLEGVEYFHGETPATADAVIFSTVVNLLWTPFTDPMATHARGLESLQRYCERVWSRCFSDRDRPPHAPAA